MFSLASVSLFFPLPNFAFFILIVSFSPCGISLFLVASRSFSMSFFPFQPFYRFYFCSMNCLSWASLLWDRKSSLSILLLWLLSSCTIKCLPTMKSCNILGLGFLHDLSALFVMFFCLHCCIVHFLLPLLGYDFEFVYSLPLSSSVAWPLPPWYRSSTFKLLSVTFSSILSLMVSCLSRLVLSSSWFLLSSCLCILISCWPNFVYPVSSLLLASV